MMKGNNKVKVDSNDVIQETVIAFLHNIAAAANNAEALSLPMVVMALFKLQTHTSSASMLLICISLRQAAALFALRLVRT